MSNEVKGMGNSYTALFWEYDSRIGRRWNLDPKPTMGLSPYAAFANSPISICDPLGDTTVPNAGGIGTVNVDEKFSSLQFYQPGTNYHMVGTQTPVPVQPGQLRSFSNELGTFSARWTKLTDGVVGFDGYINDQGQTYEEAATKYMSSLKVRLYMMLDNTGNSINKAITEDPVGFNLNLGTNLLLGAAFVATEPQPYTRGYNPTFTTQESMSGLGTLNTRRLPLLRQQNVAGWDIPLPDPLAGEYPHTVIGEKFGSDGRWYRQSATFTGGSWPKANGEIVPWSRVDWTNHGTPHHHVSPHQHIFYYNKNHWEFGPGVPFP